MGKLRGRTQPGSHKEEPGKGKDQVREESRNGSTANSIPPLEAQSPTYLSKIAGRAQRRLIRQGLMQRKGAFLLLPHEDSSHFGAAVLLGSAGA